MKRVSFPFLLSLIHHQVFFFFSLFVVVPSKRVKRKGHRISSPPPPPIKRPKYSPYPLRGDSLFRSLMFPILPLIGPSAPPLLQTRNPSLPLCSVANSPFFFPSVSVASLPLPPRYVRLPKCNHPSLCGVISFFLLSFYSRRSSPSFGLVCT